MSFKEKVGSLICSVGRKNFKAVYSLYILFTYFLQNVVDGWVLVSALCEHQQQRWFTILKEILVEAVIFLKRNYWRLKVMLMVLYPFFQFCSFNLVFIFDVASFGC
jgi:hypothetical protein